MTTNVVESYLKISDPLQIDESVSEYNYHNYEPVAGSNLNSNQQIRILIENQDLFYLPSKSFLTIKGKFVKSDGAKLADTDVATLVNNGIMYLFDRIELQIGDKVIEYINHPGQCTLMKGLLSYPKDFEYTGLNMCWTLDKGRGDASLISNNGFKLRHEKIQIRGDGNFSFVIPLSHIFGFCEDYKKVIYGVKFTLILTRCGNEDAIFKSSIVLCKVVITNITWTMPNIVPNFEQLNPLYKMIESKKSFPIGFMYRNMDSYDVAQSNEFTWRLGPRSAAEKPRYTIIAFQTDRYKNVDRNPAVFDHCDVRDIHVNLNADRYPNIDIINNFRSEDYSFTYHSAKQFRENYYGLNDNYNDFMISLNDFKDLYPLFVIDVSKQSERLKNSISDITIRVRFNSNVPAFTKCYCLILSDRLMKITSDGSRMMIDY